MGETDRGDSEREHEADRFASNMLIPRTVYDEFVRAGGFARGSSWGGCSTTVRLRSTGAMG